VTITPDTKDWTWVLLRPCAECGYDASSVDRAAVAARTRATLPLWRAALARGDAAERPRPDVWSPLEYGCHVRDVFGVFCGRLRLMLAEDDPAFPDWDQDASAVEGRYGEQDPAVVADDLVAGGEALAALFDAVPVDAWERTGRRSNGSEFTVETLALYFLHDVEHHVDDVRALT
jgi:hypothetical protein